MKQIINFNRISTAISDDERSQLIAYFYTYHKKAYCAKKAAKYYSRLIKLIFYAPLVLTTSGIVSAGSTFNPSLLIVSGVGIFISAVVRRLEPKLEHKKSSCKFSASVYAKILTELQAYLRGKKYDTIGLIHELQTKDSMLVDISPNKIAKYEKKYDTIYSKA